MATEKKEHLLQKVLIWLFRIVHCAKWQPNVHKSHRCWSSAVILMRKQDREREKNGRRWTVNYLYFCCCKYNWFICSEDLCIEKEIETDEYKLTEICATKNNCQHNYSCYEIFEIQALTNWQWFSIRINCISIRYQRTKMIMTIFHRKFTCSSFRLKQTNITEHNEFTIVSKFKKKKNKEFSFSFDNFKKFMIFLLLMCYLCWIWGEKSNNKFI